MTGAVRGAERFAREGVFAIALLVSLRCAAKDYIVITDTAVVAGFRTVQSAIDAAAAERAPGRANIFIAPGTYNETITVTQPFVSLIGTGTSPDATRIAFRSTPRSTGDQF